MPLDFQSIILTLQHFWADHGCLIGQPYYSQIGAGTMNPATFLRVLGPEPWKVAYVEPSIRPDDGRYGENPNRMQMHYQMQVILKPDPGNPQELYLKSLEALGIDQRQHDFRFVEDNWEQPALGAWGLGWEVWLDGQEITQFTYFQQAGGQLLDPVSVEITYGLDRIAIALQRVHGFTEIVWNDGHSGGTSLTCGDINLQAEQEQCKYYFEVADVSRLHQMYDLYEAEANAALERGLVLPAHDYILKCNHTFNVLDTRGAIGVTERQAFFGRMRDQARRVAEAYAEQRQRLEYPFIKEPGKGAQSLVTGDQDKVRAKVTSYQVPTILIPSPFLLEIGTEELPVGDLDSAVEQLRKRVPDLLEELRLAHGALQVWGTPRRLVIYVKDLAPRQTDLEQVVKGPPTNRAFDSLGQPTKAAEGFARSKGVALSDLQIQTMDSGTGSSSGSYVIAVVRAAGRPASEVLAEALPGLIAALRFDKSMRWNSSNVYFSRPLRWLLALYGDDRNCSVIPFEYAGLHSGNTTRGLRFRTPELAKPTTELAVRTPADYFATLAEQDIVLDRSERQQRIAAQINALAAEVGGVITPDPNLLAEVANLVETPTALRGSFDASHLQLPREVLISVMKKHQRYFPIEASNMPDNPHHSQSLLPYFITIRNGDTQGLDLVTEGNEHVIRARFADAAFFVREDIKKPLAAFLPRLGTLTFQTKLGSMLEKTSRIVQLTGTLAIQMGLNPEETATAHRAAELCKADLATKMVVEMTALQGVMGHYYAVRSGETEDVAQAIFEHYLPRFAGDASPTTRPGLAVGLADRLDTLAGLFAAGLAPTGAKDPFAQRRAALGLVSNLIAAVGFANCDMDFDVRAGLAASAALLPISLSAENQAACLSFIVERLRNLLLEQGFRYDVVDAVLTAQGFNPAGAAHAVKELSAWVVRTDWHTILPAYSRCVRILRAAGFESTTEHLFEVRQEAFTQLASPTTASEKELYAALLIAERNLATHVNLKTHTPLKLTPDTLLNTFLPMIPAINHFFDTVLVMDEDPTKRNNRLGLLQRIAGLSTGVADLSKLEGF